MLWASFSFGACMYNQETFWKALKNLKNHFISSFSLCKNIVYSSWHHQAKNKWPVATLWQEWTNTPTVLALVTRVRFLCDAKSGKKDTGESSNLIDPGQVSILRAVNMKTPQQAVVKENQKSKKSTLSKFSGIEN